MSHSHSELLGVIRELDIRVTTKQRDQHPVIVFSGPAQASIITAYQRRLSQVAPYAYVSDKKLAQFGTDDAKLFEYIRERLRGTMPGGLRKPPLKNLQLVLRILRAPISSNTHDKEDALGDYLYSHRPHRRNQDEARSLKDGAKAGMGPFGKLVDIADGLSRARFLSPYYFGLTHARRYQWFIGEVTAENGEVHNSFLGAALDLASGGADHNNKPLISRLLMSALLRDLAHATKPRPFIPWRWRHTTPFVILLGPISSKDNAALRLIDAHLHGTSKNAKSPLLLIVAGDLQLPAHTPQITARSINEGRMALAHQRASNNNYQAVTVMTDKGNADLANSTQFQPPLQPKKRRFGGFGPWLMVVLVIALGLMGANTWLQATSPCKTVSNERIGINTTGDCSLLTHKNISQADRQLEADIIAANKQAEQDAISDGSKKFATIVAFLPLTNKDGSAMEGNMDQLRAIALAQRATNKPGTGWRIKITIANAGHELSQATWVASVLCKQVSDTCGNHVAPVRIPKDNTIAGVVGIAESRSPGTFDALQIFTDAGLPVIASSVTASTIIDTNLSDEDDDYKYGTTYHISPSNPRQALVAARFAQEGLGARNAVVVAPEGDEYGLDLGQNFEAFFAPSSQTAHTIIARHGIGRGKSAPQSSEGLRGYASQFQWQNGENAEKILSAICEDTVHFDPKQDIIYFTGRAEEFAAMTRDLLACREREGPLRIVGGSDLTRFYERLEMVEVYYASFSADAGQKIADNPADAESAGARLKKFQDDYRSAYQQTSGEPKDFSNPARAHDAYESLWRLIKLVKPGTTRPLYVEALEKLKQSQHAIQFPGATGYIHMGKGTHNPEWRPIFIIKQTTDSNSNTPPARRVDLVCGKFDEGVARTSWVWEDRPRFICP